MEFLLMKVVETGNLEQLKSLIKAGADLNVSDELGRTPLMLACYARSTGCIVFGGERRL